MALPIGPDAALREAVPGAWLVALGVVAIAWGVSHAVRSTDPRSFAAHIRQFGQH